MLHPPPSGRVVADVEADSAGTAGAILERDQPEIRCPGDHRRRVDAAPGSMRNPPFRGSERRYGAAYNQVSPRVPGIMNMWLE